VPTLAPISPPARWRSFIRRLSRSNQAWLSVAILNEDPRANGVLVRSMEVDCR
jgi:hypothetical protein